MTARLSRQLPDVPAGEPVFGLEAGVPGLAGRDRLGHLVDVRREGDHATPTGVFPFGLTMYGNGANPGGLHEAYHHLVCGDWWDEDPYSNRYNRFVHVRCGSTPPFAAWSEALWTDPRSYRYLAVIDFNLNPTIRGRKAPGSGSSCTPGCTARLRDVWPCRSRISWTCCAGSSLRTIRSSRWAPMPRSVTCRRRRPSCTADCRERRRAAHERRRLAPTSRLYVGLTVGLRRTAAAHESVTAMIVAT